MHFTRTRTSVLVLLLAIGLGACASASFDPAAMSGIGAALFALVLALPLGGRARAGAPMPCDGFEATSCEGGYVRTHCCPAGTKCNFDFPAFIPCGHGTCTVGKDVGRCPAPTASSIPAKSEAECGGGWETACVSRKVTKACIPPVPTNYTGPTRNPPFRGCGDGRAQLEVGDQGAPKPGDRCTTHMLLEDCFPTRAELLPRTCLGGWKKVCLGGKVEDRCLPPFASESRYPATQYVACDDGSCAVGADKAACPAR